MKNFIREESSLILTSEGFDRVTGKLSDGSSTLLEMLQGRAEQFPNKPSIGAINKALEIEYMTYSEINFCAKKFAQFLENITKPGEIIGIASANRPEWLIAEQASYYCNCVNAPLYTTFKEEALSYIISTTNMRVLVAAPSFAKMTVEKIIDYVPADLMPLEYIILMDKDQEVEAMCINKGIKVSTINEILFSDLEGSNPFYSDPSFTICSKAAKYFKDHPKGGLVPLDQSRGFPKSEDLATLSFTSGTTGIPKGVKLTHRNFISQIESYEMGRKDYDLPDIQENSLYFSCLPLSHVFERVVFCVCFSAGAKICFFRGDKLKLGEDIKLVQPTFLAAVPKILQVFHQKIEEGVSKKKFYERLIYRAALNFKIFLQKFNIYSVSVLDNLIFKKVAEGFGGKIETILCGGAAVDRYLIEYLRAVLNAHIFQGYGQTEGLGANIVATTGMKDSSTVGVPFPSTKFKLVSIESTTHGASSEKAMFLKGHSITKGYFQPSQDILERLLATGKFSFKISNIRESPFDEDGWLITGDVAIYEKGNVYIVGRTKDLVKLDNGEYISPENIENKLRETDLVKDVFISKIPGEDKFVALVAVPNDSVTLYQIANYLKTSIDKLVHSKVIPRCVEISKFAILRKNFIDVDDGVLFTPTLKKKRFVFSQKFDKILSKSLSIDEVLNGKTIDIKKVE